MRSPAIQRRSLPLLRDGFGQPERGPTNTHPGGHWQSQEQGDHQCRQFGYLLAQVWIAELRHGPEEQQAQQKPKAHRQAHLFVVPHEVPDLREALGGPQQKD